MTRTAAGRRARVAAAASAASAGAATDGCRAPATTAATVAADTTGNAPQGPSGMTGQRPRSTTPPPVPGGAAAVAAAGGTLGGGASVAAAGAAGRWGGGSAVRRPESAGRGALAASSAASGGRSRSELAENLLRTATWARVSDRDHLRPTPRPPRALPPGLRDPASRTVVLLPPAAPAPLPVGVPIEVADACDVDGEGPWRTLRAASGGAMPGPGDTAAIDEAWTRMPTVGEAGGYLAPDAAPNVLKSLAAVERPLAAEYFRHIVRVNEVAVLLPEPMAGVTEMFCIDGAEGFAWLVALQRQLPTLRETTWGDVSVGLESWVGREPLLTSIPLPRCWNVVLNAAVSPAAVKSKVQETRY